MRSLLLLAILVAPLVAGGQASGTTTFLELSGDLPEDGWVAFRFNLTGPSDVAALGVLYPCFVNESRGASVMWSIQDGRRVYTASKEQGGGPWWTDRDTFRLHTPLVDHRVRGPPVGEPSEEWCRNGHLIGFGARYPEARRSVIGLAVANSERGSYRVSVKWTYGVESYDVATGQALLRFADEFTGGAAVSVDSLPFTGEAGVALRLDHHTDHDTVGEFLTQPPGGGENFLWSCTRNGDACGEPTGSWGEVPLAAEGPTDWAFEIPATYGTTVNSHKVILVEFPDDTWLELE